MAACLEMAEATRKTDPASAQGYLAIRTVRAPARSSMRALLPTPVDTVQTKVRLLGPQPWGLRILTIQLIVIEAVLVQDYKTTRHFIQVDRSAIIMKVIS